ncbi:MAG: PIN domain-containing protein [Deltaproteobacteria bacterium]|nr:PIN domain-containing protein [Deltaproteobacteria bacterium]
MPTTSDLALVDTNILVYSLSKECAEYTPSRALREQAQSDDAGLCIAPQTIAEFYAVVTNARRVREPFSPPDALAEIDKLVALPGMTLLGVPPDVVSRLMQLLRDHPVVGRKVFDVQLAATMLGNGVRRIYTYNTQDFAPFADLTVLTPP